MRRLFLSILVLAAPCWAQEADLPATLSLAVAPCTPEPVPWQRVLAQLEVELRASSVRVEHGAIGDVQVILDVPDCAANATRAHVVLFANRSGRSASADVTLLEMSPRQVALAIVELVR